MTAKRKLTKATSAPEDSYVANLLERISEGKQILALPKGEKLRITEAYSEFKLNPEIDAKAFELPK